ncbi:MAG: hypothetical protein LBG11_07720 [Bifidobacteriaceae bacterium]|nr:hypothetical protein [Bifidobacteriaceae bacterium]
MSCPNCGSLAQSGQPFCDVCGSPTGLPGSRLRLCPMPSAWRPRRA